MKLSKSKNLQDKTQLCREIDQRLHELNAFLFPKPQSGTRPQFSENVIVDELDILLTKADKFLDQIQVIFHF